MSAVEKFPVLLNEAEEESSAVPPCFSDDGINVSRLYPAFLISQTAAPLETGRRGGDADGSYASSTSTSDTTTSTCLL